MLGKIPNKHQVTIFQTPLVNFINMDHELVHLAQHIDWDEVDRGYRGRKWIGDTKVEIPGKSKPTDSYYKKTKTKNKFRRRAGIEPVIGHLKQDHRMQRNYLKGNVGDSINTMMVAAGFNLKHWLNKIILVFNLIYRILIAEVLNTFT